MDITKTVQRLCMHRMFWGLNEHFPWNTCFYNFNPEFQRSRLLVYRISPRQHFCLIISRWRALAQCFTQSTTEATRHVRACVACLRVWVCVRECACFSLGLSFHSHPHTFLQLIGLVFFWDLRVQIKPVFVWKCLEVFAINSFLPERTFGSARYR